MYRYIYIYVNTYKNAFSGKYYKSVYEEAELYNILNFFVTIFRIWHFINDLAKAMDQYWPVNVFIIYENTY